MMTTFVAIDFETANYYRDSACQVALIRVEDGEIVKRFESLIQPPYSYFSFTYIHGITWQDVEDSPKFSELWDEIEAFIEDAEFLVAHNAPFDRSVLNACCKTYGLEPPNLEFQCTMRVARETWGIYPTKLPDVCDSLDIQLQHHDALSDAEACARIMIEALDD